MFMDIYMYIYVNARICNKCMCLSLCAHEGVCMYSACRPAYTPAFFLYIHIYSCPIKQHELVLGGFLLLPR